MRRSTLFASAATLILVMAGAATARAQTPPVTTPQTMPGPTPDADALAVAMRRLAENPRDVDALLTAGELSLRLGDASGAASLFKRAEQVDPANGRVKAGMASILVRSERPGEALRYFGQAEGFGLDPRRFASDRGLAYDLIGQQERAQRDYRLVLKSNPDDETIRRYALSLGISGKQDAALEQIDTLLRKGDRGAWRARAFILAMSGDVAGATRIATSMIPGMARALQPFFTRLASLGAADRAFAVTFGEVGPTPERLADARLTPALAPLAPDPSAAAVASVTLPMFKADARRQRRERRRRGSLDRIEVASAAPKIAALPPPPGFGSAGASPTDPVQVAPAPARQPVTVTSNTAAPPVATSKPAPARGIAVRRVDAAPVQRNEALRAGSLAAVARAERQAAPATRQAATPVAATPVAVPAPAISRAPAPVQVAAAETRPPSVPASSVPVSAPVLPNEVPAVTAAAATSAPPQQPPLQASVSATRAPIPAAAPAASSPVPAVAAPASSALPPANAAAIAPAAETPPAPAAPSPPPSRAVAVAASTTPVPPRMSEDSILAKIIAGITIPGYELGVGAPPPAPVPEIVSATAVAPGSPATTDARDAPAPVVDTAAIERQRAEDAVATKAAEQRAAAEAKAQQDCAALADKKRADAKALAAKKAADAKALAAKKAADEKALAARKAADEKKAAKADPPRIWVQVAGGAYEGDLPKSWAAVKARASALAGRQGYSTPLRATNRVVTGPFKTSAEAQAFVNTLGKQGVSAFTFTSTAGQKVTRLPAK